MLAAAEELTLREAAERFDISHQAVQQAFRKLFGDAPPPATVAKQRRNETLLAALRAGTTTAELEQRTGIAAHRVRNIASRAGVRILGPVRSWDAAVAAVAAGASIGEAAADHGVSYARLADHCRAAGVRSVAHGRRTYGRAKKAAGLVIAKQIRVPEAARRMRVAPAAVRRALARMTASARLAAMEAA